MFAFFESRIRPTLVAGTSPPSGLLAFYWHFIRQTRGLYAAMFVTGLAVALIDTAIPVFIGRLVGLMETSDRLAAFQHALPALDRHGAARPRSAGRSRSSPTASSATTRSCPA